MATTATPTPESVLARHPGWQIHRGYLGWHAVPERPGLGAPVSAAGLAALDSLLADRDTAKAA